MKFLEDIILRLGAVDRRVIFVLIGLAVLVPLLTPISLPVRETPTTVKFYDGIEDIPKNSKVLVSFDYGPSTCLLYTSPSPRDVRSSRMPSSA